MIRILFLILPTVVLLASTQAQQQCVPFTKIGIGVGVEKIASGEILVDQVIPGTPAEKAGMLAKDKIVGIVSIPGSLYVPAKSISLEEAVEMIRGQVGTIIYLDVLREDFPLNFQIIREKIEVNC